MNRSDFGYLVPVPTYVIGDIHGCFLTLQQLLKQIRFEPGRDRLWCVGDLVNRGPHSLEVLRWARDLGEGLVTVLGNHDLHLLERALGNRRPRKWDTLDAVLAAEDRDDLVTWLLHRPLAHYESRYLMVHAGLLPGWSIEQLQHDARQTEGILRGKRAEELLENLTSRQLLSSENSTSEIDYCSFLLNVLTTLRTCTAEGRPCPGFAGPPDQAPEGCQPWFSIADRRAAQVNTLFGHWSTLGLYRSNGIVCLDSGCVHGGELTALRLEDGHIFQEPRRESP